MKEQVTSKMVLEEFEQLAYSLGLPPSKEQMTMLSVYCVELAKYNEHTNLVSRSDAANLWQAHILDSWATAATIKQLGLSDGKRWVADIGTGAGLPGLIIAIAFAKLSVVLVDSVAKKTKFLQEVVSELGLGRQVEVVTARAEELGREGRFREKFDFVTARAVGVLPLVAELTIPLLKVEGILLLQKTVRQLTEDTMRAKNALPALQAQLLSPIYLDERLLGKGHVIMPIKKLRTTPAMFPRSMSQIRRSPLA